MTISLVVAGGTQTGNNGNIVVTFPSTVKYSNGETYFGPRYGDVVFAQAFNYGGRQMVPANSGFRLAPLFHQSGTVQWLWWAVWGRDIFTQPGQNLGFNRIQADVNWTTGAGCCLVRGLDIDAPFGPARYTYRADTTLSADPTFGVPGAAYLILICKTGQATLAEYSDTTTIDWTLLYGESTSAGNDGALGAWIGVPKIRDTIGLPEYVFFDGGSLSRPIYTTEVALRPAPYRRQLLSVPLSFGKPADSGFSYVARPVSRLYAGQRRVFPYAPYSPGPAFKAAWASQRSRIFGAGV